MRAIAESKSDHPKSMKRVAKELGCSPYHLAKLFPSEAANIRSRFEAYRIMDQEQRRAKREERIRLAFGAALSRGISTSERSLKRHGLVAPGDARLPEFKTIKREVLGLS